MGIEKRCAQLKAIYEIYETFTACMNLACRKHCAACCTCNVVMTTLEGWMIYEHLLSISDNGDAALNSLVQTPPARRFQPAVTINRMVEMCALGEQPPDEQNDPSAGRCRLTDNDICSIYTVRPFGCRAMTSTEDCSLSGEAHMPDLILSANNVVMQFIEALDRPGASGNMTDVLLFFSDANHRQKYLNRRHMQWPSCLKPNQGFSVLMIPPEHRTTIQPLVRDLKAVLGPSALP